MASARILVGVVVAAHGVRGQVKIRSLAEYFGDRSRCDLSDKAGKRHFRLTPTGRFKEGIIASVEGVADRNEAEKLKHVELYAEREALPSLKPHEYYHGDLVGMQARLSTGEAFGEVVGVHNYGASDILEIRRAEKKETELFVFNRVTFPEINVKKSRLTINPPEIIKT